jgi:hypothetical protein
MNSERLYYHVTIDQRNVLGGWKSEQTQLLLLLLLRRRLARTNVPAPIEGANNLDLHNCLPACPHMSSGALAATS